MPLSPDDLQRFKDVDVRAEAEKIAHEIDQQLKFGYEGGTFVARELGLSIPMAVLHEVGRLYQEAGWLTTWKKEKAGWELTLEPDGTAFIRKLRRKLDEDAKSWKPRRQPMPWEYFPHKYLA